MVRTAVGAARSDRPQSVLTHSSLILILIFRSGLPFGGRRQGSKQMYLRGLGPRLAPRQPQGGAVVTFSGPREAVSITGHPDVQPGCSLEADDTPPQLLSDSGLSLCHSVAPSPQLISAHPLTEAVYYLTGSQDILRGK